MTEARLVSSDNAACRCGCTTARVRVRGNAFSAVCVECGHAQVVPMLHGQELRDAWGEGELVHPVSIMRAKSVLPAREPVLAVRFELPT